MLGNIRYINYVDGDNWITSPLSCKIDAIIDADSYHSNIVLWYNTATDKYTIAESNTFFWEAEWIPLFKKISDEEMTEADVLALIEDQIEEIKNQRK